MNATHHDAETDATLAHHFDTPKQQYEAAKLGMWLFLGTEILLFGGLFCVYTVYRSNHPELFDYGSRFLDTSWGAINTVVLILSSFTIAMAVLCAQRNNRRALIAFLAMTIFLGIDFLGIKYIEYSHKFHDNLVWGLDLYELTADEALTQRLARADAEHAPPMLDPGDAEKGKPLYLRTCLGCHGARGQGLPGLGKALLASSFVAQSSDAELLSFLKAGRSITDPANTSGISMPARGGNPRLRDQGLQNIIAFMRTLQSQQAQSETALADSDQIFVIPMSVVPPAENGPQGINFQFIAEAEYQDISVPSHDKPPSPRLDNERPANLHLFFGIYFMMTGLHGLHVILGLIAITWLLVRAVRGEFSSRYFTPVDLGGLYWHIVDIIWIFLFPLLYLIH